MKRDRIWGGLDFLWHFLAQPTQNNNNDFVIALGLMTLVLQQIYLTYLTSRITLPFSSVQPIQDIPTLFSSGYRIVFTKKYAKAPEKFIAFFKDSFSLCAPNLDPMKLLVTANETNNGTDNITISLLKWTDAGAILGSQLSKSKIMIRAEKDRSHNGSCYMINKSFYVTPKTQYFRGHHSASFHRFLFQFYMFGYSLFWAKIYRAADTRMHQKDLRVKSDGEVVTSISEKTPMSQSFMLCAISMSLTLPIFFLELSWFRTRRHVFAERNEVIGVWPRAGFMSILSTK